MSPRATHYWIAWLLPLLVLRAIVPVGFMPSWSDGGLQIVLCSGFVPSSNDQRINPSANEHGHHHHAEQAPASHQHHSSDGSQVHENSLCPFAAAGSATVPTATPVAIIALLTTSDRFDFVSNPELSSALASINRIRGPPLASYI